MDLNTILTIAERARERRQLLLDDQVFLREIVPRELESFPQLELPKSIRHPGDFSVSGASVGTFLRSALLVAAQKAFGRRFGGSEFYEKVEKDLAFGIMRSHFHLGYPKGRSRRWPATSRQNRRRIRREQPGERRKLLKTLLIL